LDLFLPAFLAKMAMAAVSFKKRRDRRQRQEFSRCSIPGRDLAKVVNYALEMIQALRLDCKQKALDRSLVLHAKILRDSMFAI
jgi:hypothetical protein